MQTSAAPAAAAAATTTNIIIIVNNNNNSNNKRITITHDTFNRIFNLRMFIKKNPLQTIKQT